MSYIKRAIENEYLKSANNSKSVAITGARQVGKTTLTKSLFPNVPRINMKSDYLYNAALEDVSSFLKSYSRPLFIDEVQRAPFILNEIKVILDEVGGVKNYFFSGSQKWKLMKGLSDSLAGMVSILELNGLSMREINEIDFNKPFLPTNDYINEREKYLKKYENIWFYIHNGFYPELYENTNRDWKRFYADYVSTYIERDVYDIIAIKDANLFYKFLVSVAARTAQMLNYANIADDIGADVGTIKSWISILERTGIIYILQPYFNSHLSRAIKTPKVYFRDTGLAAYLTNWNTPEQLKDGAMNGAFFETYVVNEIIKSYSNCGEDYSRFIYYYRGKDKIKVNGEAQEGEIDLIIEQDGTLYPIEIKKNTAVKAEMASIFTILDKDLDKKRGQGAIICNIDHKLYLRDNLIALPIEYI